MTFKKAALAMVAATSLVAMPTVAVAQTASASKLSLRNAPAAERAGPEAEGSDLGGGSIIVAILAAAAVIAAIVIAVDGGNNDPISA